MSITLNFLGGAPFQLLYDGVRIAIGRTSNFRTLLLNLESTLECLQPRIIQQIRDHNVELNLPNDVIQDLQVKMDDGVELVAKLSRLSMWNCRIWGDCCNCIKPSYADQLAALDRSLRRLLEILKLEQMKNVTELLLLARRTSDKQDDLERRQLEILKSLQETGDILRSQQDILQRIERNGAASSAPAHPAPALGAVFRVLFDVVIQVKVKNMMYKRLLEDFKSTLDCLKPLVEEMVESNRLLQLSKEQQENFLMQMEKGVELVHKVRMGTSYRKKEYTKKLVGLDEYLQRLFIELKGQVARNVKETLVLVSNLEKEITNIEGGGVEQSDEIESERWIPLPQPRSPLVGVDLQNVQGPQKVIKEILDSISNLEKEIKEIGGDGVARNDEIPEPSLPTAGSSQQSMQVTRDVIKERWDSENLRDVKQIKGKGVFEYPAADEHADAYSVASLEEPIDDEDEYSSFTVGLDVYVSKLKRKLLDDDDELALVLTGPEACGKTRLAETFCQDEEVKNEFKNIFFVPVSQNPALRLIFQQLYPEEGYREITLPFQQAANAIQWLQAFVKHVGHGPSLLVLDDVWPGSESLLDEFDEFKASNFKILVTSRFEFPRFGSSYYVRPMTGR